MNSVLYKTIRLSLIVGCGVLFAVFAIINLLYVYRNLLYDNIWINDFFGMWSYGKFLLGDAAPKIYDNDTLLDLQMELGACPKCLLPYAYPPFFLFFIAPLGVFS